MTCKCAAQGIDVAEHGHGMFCPIYHCYAYEIGCCLGFEPIEEWEHGGWPGRRPTPPNGSIVSCECITYAMGTNINLDFSRRDYTSCAWPEYDISPGRWPVWRWRRYTVAAPLLGALSVALG